MWRFTLKIEWTYVFFFSYKISHSCRLSITFLFIYWLFFFPFACLNITGNVVAAALCICYRYSLHKSLFNWNIQNTKHNHLTFCSYALVVGFFFFLRLECMYQMEGQIKISGWPHNHFIAIISKEKTTAKKTDQQNKNIHCTIKDKHLPKQIYELTKKKNAHDTNNKQTHQVYENKKAAEKSPPILAYTWIYANQL